MSKKLQVTCSLIVLAVILFTTSANALSLGARTLQFRHTGADVEKLQQKLQTVGHYQGAIDGFYGGQTEDAVIEFQIDQQLTIDGLAGWNTIQNLKQVTNNNYQVQSGDSLFKIAHKFNTSVQALQEVNGLQSESIYPGQKLTIPKSSTSSSGNYTRLDLSKQELDLLTKAVYSEARGESYTGQVAVAAVILNRVEDPRFPDTIKGVIFQPWAFTAVHNGQFWLEPDQRSRKAALDAVQGWDPTGRAVFYYNPVKVTSHWIYTRDIIKKIGKHYFAG
ncbi:spore cortex-lytic enzyme [Halanaerobaculum tunisiense]